MAVKIYKSDYKLVNWRTSVNLSNAATKKYTTINYANKPYLRVENQ